MLLFAIVEVSVLERSRTPSAPVVVVGTAVEEPGTVEGAVPLWLVNLLVKKEKEPDWKLEKMEVVVMLVS